MESIAVPNALNISQKSHEGMSGKANEDSLGVFAWKIDDQQDLILGVVADGVGGVFIGLYDMHTIQDIYHLIRLPQFVRNNCESL